MWLKISICNLHIVFCTIHVQPHTRRQFHFTGWPVHTVSTFQQPISQYLILSKERRILWSATWLMLTHWLARYCVARACVGFAIAKTVNRQDSWAGAKQLDQYSLSRHQLTACLLFPFNLKGKRKNNNKNIGLRVKPITTRRDVMHESALTSSPVCRLLGRVSALSKQLTVFDDLWMTWLSPKRAWGVFTRFPAQAFTGFAVQDLVIVDTR